MPFPTTPVLDQFTTAGGPPPDANWSNVANGLKASGGVCVAQNHSGGFECALWSNSTFGPASEVYALIPTKAGNGEGMEMYARMTTLVSSTMSGYYLELVPGSPNDTVTINVMTNGAHASTLGTYTQAVSNGDSLGMTVVSTTVTAFYKSGAGSWTVLGSATDNTYGAAGYIGLSMVTTSALAAFDNFGGGNQLITIAMSECIGALGKLS